MNWMSPLFSEAMVVYVTNSLGTKKRQFFKTPVIGRSKPFANGKKQFDNQSLILFTSLTIKYRYAMPGIGGQV